MPSQRRSCHETDSKVFYQCYINNNSKYTPPGYTNHDPLFKIQPFSNFLIQRYCSFFYPEENLIVNEDMLFEAALSELHKK